MTKTLSSAELRKLARAYREAWAGGHTQPLPDGGYVMVADGVAVSWSLRPRSEDSCPGVIAVPAKGNIMRAEGGNNDSGAKRWEVVL